MLDPNCAKFTELSPLTFEFDNLVIEFIKFTRPLLSKFKPLSVAIPLASGVNVLDNCDSFVPSTASNFCIPLAIRVKSDSFTPWKLCIAPLRIFTPLASFCKPLVSTLPRDLDRTPNLFMSLSISLFAFCASAPILICRLSISVATIPPTFCHIVKKTVQTYVVPSVFFSTFGCSNS